jgi:hypothetical protein
MLKNFPLQDACDPIYALEISNAERASFSVLLPIVVNILHTRRIGNFLADYR